MFSSFFHFGLYPTPLISYIAVPHFFFVQAISGYEDNLLSGECDFGGVIGGEASLFAPSVL